MLYRGHARCCRSWVGAPTLSVALSGPGPSPIARVAQRSGKSENLKISSHGAGFGSSYCSSSCCTGVCTMHLCSIMDLCSWTTSLLRHCYPIDTVPYDILLVPCNGWFSTEHSRVQLVEMIVGDSLIYAKESSLQLTR